MTINVRLASSTKAIVVSGAVQGSPSVANRLQKCISPGVIGDSQIVDGVTASKLLTLAAADTYTLTVPATGTAALLGIVNAFADATEATILGAGAITTAGGIYATKKIISGSTLTGTQLVSTIATGTAPLSVASTTVVANLNASLLGGATFAAPGAIGGTTPGSAAFTTISATGAITSTLATGTAPFTVASTTVVGNLNVSQLLGATWAAPLAIGSTTPAAAAFTTVSATGAITSTLATGSAPFVVASTTVVANLNASLLLGQTWANPGAIGGTTPGSAAFTTISATGAITSTLATGTAPFVVASTTVVGNLNVSALLGQTWANPGAIGGTTPAAIACTTLTASSTISATVADATSGLKIQRVADDSQMLLAYSGGQFRIAATYGSTGAYKDVTIYTSDVERLTVSAAGVINIYGTTPGTPAATEVFIGNGQIKVGAGLTCATITTSSTTLHVTSASLTNGAAAAAGTLLNAPAAGNPTKWVPIDDNGTVRYIPAW